jgi:hypothetical protein
MKNYLAVFLGSPEKVAQARADMSEESKQKMREGMMAWGKWIEDHKAAIVNDGSPLGKTMKVSAAGIEPVSNDMGAWIVVQAESHEAAAKMFEGHPHYTIFPGDRIEVMEMIPIPTMA